MKKRVLSGIRSTGQLHLGNYFGALRNFVKLQDEAECYFFIADYHSLTTHPDPTILHSNVRNILSEYLAAGIDPEKATIYVQSDVPEVAELSLLLGMHAYVGELERTASFKDKVRKNPNNVNIGLLNYPVLMASDILLHRADYVPVGKDQEQHLEMTRHLAHRFNQIYKTDFFNEKVALHVTRAGRWDSDHVVLLDDETKEIANEIVRNDACDRVLIALDYFDASINRISAWVVGMRNMQKALLNALLTPHADFKKMQDDGNITELMAKREELKSYPWGEVWAEFCRRNGIIEDAKWFDEVKAYEKEVLSKRA